MTIINPHNMTRHYLLWGVSLTSVAVLGGLVFTLQPEPLLLSLPNWVLTVAYSITGCLTVLAIIFKFVFAREPVAWTLVLGIALVGTLVIVLSGWQLIYLAFHIGAFVGLFVLGPYLRFD